MKKRHKPSEGEHFIAEYFEFVGLKYEAEKEITFLKGDSKTHRRADFFLPKYNLYVEFFGRWNHSKEERKRYREKKNVFFKNRVPCVYIYPENLGILDFSFPRRAIKELSLKGQKRELFKLKLRFVTHENIDQLFWSLLGLSISVGTILSEPERFFWILIGFAFSIYNLYKILRFYMDLKSFED